MFSIKKISLIFSVVLFALLVSCRQKENALIFGDTKSGPDISVLAVLLSWSGGLDSTEFCTYKILKNFSDKEFSDTIKVKVPYSTTFELQPDTVLLNINLPDTHSGAGYYTYFRNNRSEAVKPVKISYIDFDYWEGCETGKGKCVPLHFTRKKDDQYYYLIMPCGGTETSVTLSGQRGPLQSTHIHANQCPPVFNLSSLEDGTYHANMMACGLGGTVEFTIKTEE